MTGEESEFASRCHIGNPNQYRNSNIRAIEISISRELFHDFAWCWCRENGIVDLFKCKLKIIGYFSSRHPCDERSEITIFLERIH